MGKSRLNPVNKRYSKLLDNDTTAKLYIGFYQKIIVPKNFSEFPKEVKTKIIDEYIKQIDKIKSPDWEINNIHIRLDDGKVERLI